MKPGGHAEPYRILTDLAGSGATGALHLGGPSPGVLHLAAGRVVHATSATVPGVGDLLTVSGRLPVSVWQAAVEEGTADNRVGAVLVEHGHLTAGELELAVLGVVYDAAYFVLGDAEVPVRFEQDRPHWLGTVAAVDVAALTREVARRRGLLRGIIDRPQLDTAPVVPTPRLRRDRITLTALQWELVVAADGVANPTDLARRLGRSGYACVQEVRRLAAAGLVRIPEAAPTPPTAAPVRTPEAAPAPPIPQAAPAPPAAAEAVPVPRVSPEAAPEPETAAGPDVAAPAVPVVAPPPDTTVELPHAGAGPAPQRGFRLPRRKPGGKPQGDAEPAAVPDETLLLRLRAALRGMA